MIAAVAVAAAHRLGATAVRLRIGWTAHRYEVSA